MKKIIGMVLVVVIISIAVYVIWMTPKSSVTDTTAKVFIETMLTDLGLNYPITKSTMEISFPAEDGSEKSVQKILSGYVISYTENSSVFNGYLNRVIGPNPAWLTSEKGLGYINDSLVCLQNDASYLPGTPRYNPNIPQHGQQIFCAVVSK